MAEAVGAGAAASARAQGILVTCLGTVFLTGQDAITKLLTAEFSPPEILFFRGLAALLPLTALIWVMGGRARLRSVRPWVNLTRACLALGSSLCVVWSFALMPLADALAIVFTNPLIMTAMSGPCLGERVNGRQWAAVGAGFLGALLIIKPAAGLDLTWHVLVPLGAALTGATRDIITRRLGATEHPETVLVYTMAVMLIGSAVVAGIHGAHWPSGAAWAMFVAAAVLVTAAYYLAIVGLKLAAAAVVAPYRYLSLVWASALGWSIWGDLMEPMKLAGCLLVVGSGIYLLHAETAARGRL
jgi:drug/metabolite transporter (DMT)-like permease